MEEKDGFGKRLKHAWNAFVNQDQDTHRTYEYGGSYSTRPDRSRVNIANERSILAAVFTRLAIDVATSDIRHIRLDDEDRYLEDINSGLNNCLQVEANIDQGARMFLQDLAYTMFAQGVLAVVPVDTSLNPNVTGSYDILTMRIGLIVDWMPTAVRVRLYNENTGKHEEITVEKKIAAIIENPFYSVMNEPNSTFQRLIRKLSLLDSIDELSASGKLDLLIQLPYTIKSEARRQQAQQRTREIEFQLKGSQYGIAYVDGTEKVTQLNRPVDNTIMKHVEYLMNLFYTQLGLTPEVMNGTADEAAMLNYHNRTVEPILTAITQEFRRKFLTKTARAQKQTVEHFRDPFKLVPLSVIAEIADKFTRNEITSSNEMRRIIGLKPSKDPKANQLRNSNMPESELGNTPQKGTNVVPFPKTASSVEITRKENSQNGSS